MKTEPNALPKIIARDFDPKKDLPYLFKIGKAKVALIGNFQNYNKSMVHISKDPIDIQPYCGVALNLGFCFVSETGFQYDDTKMFTLQEVKGLDKVCKKCLKSLTK